eukprot:9730426-Lingulodinium_polyedra.AAC.1
MRANTGVAMAETFRHAATLRSVSIDAIQTHPGNRRLANAWRRSGRQQPKPGPTCLPARTVALAQ